MRLNSRAWQTTLTGLAFMLTLQTADAQRGPRPPPDYDAFYALGPDSLEREGVPKGTVRGPFVLPNSKAYPGTQHTYWVYVPAQYDPAVPQAKSSQIIFKFFQLM